MNDLDKAKYQSPSCEVIYVDSATNLLSVSDNSIPELDNEDM